MKIDFDKYTKNINYEKYKENEEKLNNKLLNDEMTDWTDINKCITREEIDKIIKTSDYIRNKCDAFIVIGIGGSFLGSKMVINALNTYFKSNKPEIIFVGTDLSSEYLYELKNYLIDKDICVNVISKSGSTLETSIAFDYIEDILKEKYNDYTDRVYITTDSEKSILLDLAKEKGYTTFNVPKYIGGRYSVLTPVGLLPICVAGYDINKLLKGTLNVDKSLAYKYAVYRHEMYNMGKYIESYTFYEEKLLFLGEWLKQLFGESHGKERKGILPISVLNTRDLHSLGQYFQDGSRILFETVIYNKTDIKIDTKYNMTLSKINEIAVDGVAKAHFEDDCPSMIITIENINEETLGEIIYFFELACAYGGYLLDINPFDQPGVSKYKNIINSKLNKNML